ELVALARAHEAEVLGQGHELRPIARGLRDQAARAVEVALDARSRDHLQRGDLHRFTFSTSLAASPSLRSTRSIFGSAHGPVTWNSRVPACVSGLRRNICARKVPSPTAGLITA